MIPTARSKKSNAIFAKKSTVLQECHSIFGKFMVKVFTMIPTLVIKMEHVLHGLKEKQKKAILELPAMAKLYLKS